MNGYGALVIFYLILIVAKLAFYLYILYLAYKGASNLYYEIRTLIENKNDIKVNLKLSCLHKDNGLDNPNGWLIKEDNFLRIIFKWVLLCKKESLENTCSWVKVNKSSILFLVILLCSPFYAYSFYYHIPPIAGYIYDQDGKPLADIDVEIEVTKHSGSSFWLGLGESVTVNKYYAKIDGNGHYQTESIVFLSSKDVSAEMIVRSNYYLSLYAKDKKLKNHCYKSISEMDYSLVKSHNGYGMPIYDEISSNYYYISLLDKDKSYYIMQRKDNGCHVFRARKTSLGWWYSNTNPVIMPNLTLYNKDLIRQFKK